jgi:hypothetical protein
MLRFDLVALILFASLIPLGSTSAPAQTFPGTQPWKDTSDPALAMVEGIHRFLDRELKASIERRQTHWNRDRSSPDVYVASIAANGDRFRTIIGAVGERVSPVELSYVSGPESPARVAENDKVTIYAVRWSVYPGVDAEWLLLEPKGEITMNLVAMADCGTTPEQFARIVPGLAPDALSARQLAEEGCRVLVPTLIDRTAEFSGSPLVRMTNLPHREWVYRMAFETGRHINWLRSGQGSRGGRLVHTPRRGAASHRRYWHRGRGPGRLLRRCRRHLDRRDESSRLFRPA